MTDSPSDIAFTTAVKAAQEKYGSRPQLARAEGRGFMYAKLDKNAVAFISHRESFYLGTASADGRPYIQHRGGPMGFLRVLNDHTLAFADFGGNRQYITAGNLSENPKAFIFLMDYANRRRLKIWGRAEVVEGDETLIGRVHDQAYEAKPERVIRFHLETWDANCPQHITRRYTEDQVATVVAKLETRIAELEEELARLRPEKIDAT